MVESDLTISLCLTGALSILAGDCFVKTAQAGQAVAGVKITAG